MNMRLCDRCEDRANEAFLCDLTICKAEKKGGKTKRRQIIRMTIDLCDPCLTEVCKAMGKAKANHFRTKEPPCSPTNS